jgi:hypothetical protein
LAKYSKPAGYPTLLQTCGELPFQARLLSLLFKKAITQAWRRRKQALGNSEAEIDALPAAF